jgi:hypothetical protein
MPKRNLVGLQITGSLTVWEDELPIGSMTMIDDNRIEASVIDDYRSLGVFDDINKAAGAILKSHRLATTAA